MSFSLTPVRLGLLTAIVALQACDSSNSSDPAIKAQAVDGYIVAADVSCDAVPTGNATAAAGRFTCPAGTDLMSVSGGQDVGSDELATDGGIPFTGELVGPANLDFVTPLSTLAVAMATDENGAFVAANFAKATDDLAAVFGESELDLNKNPATTLQLASLNAQVHEVLSAFVESPANYGKAVTAFAEFVNDTSVAGQTVSLSVDAFDVLTKVNAELTTIDSTLAIPGDRVQGIAEAVQASNGRFAGANNIDELDKVAKEVAVEQAALTIDRDATQVSFLSEGASTQTSIGEFEDSALTARRYNTRISTSLTGISYDNNFIRVNRDLNGVKASLGFEMKGVGSDQRSLSYITDDALFTAKRGIPGSLQVTIPEKAQLHVTSRSLTGAETKITITLDGQHAFTNDDNTISVNNARVREELESRGIADVLTGSGNYEVTFAIGGLRVNSVENGTPRANSTQTIQANTATLAGTGVKGYITVLDN